MMYISLAFILITRAVHSQNTDAFASTPAPIRVPSDRHCIVNTQCTEQPITIDHCVRDLDWKFHQCQYCTTDPVTHASSGYPLCPENKSEWTTCGDLGFLCPIPAPTPPTQTPTMQSCPDGAQIKEKRTFFIENHCEFDLWIGFNGKPWYHNNIKNDEFVFGYLPHDGGLYLSKHNTTRLQLPYDLQGGALWARTNCRTENGALRCDTGECQKDFNSFSLPHGQCCGIDTQFSKFKCAGPSAPTSLIEFTFAEPDSDLCSHNDYYDVSLVDGYNLPLRVEPVNFDAVAGNVPEQFACKPTEVNEFDAERNCPEMLKWHGSGTDSHRTYCLGLCKAVDTPEHRGKWPVLQALFEKAVSEYEWHGQQANDHRAMKDLVCCRCGTQADVKYDCYDEQQTCEFGCSAYNDGIPDKWSGNESAYDARTCPKNGIVYDNKRDYTMPDWPLIPSEFHSKNGRIISNINAAYLYKETSPLAYSWQFNDQSATFQCRNSDYRISFCHNNVVPTSPTTAAPTGSPTNPTVAPSESPIVPTVAPSGIPIVPTIAPTAHHSSGMQIWVVVVIILCVLLGIAFVAGWTYRSYYVETVIVEEETTVSVELGSDIDLSEIEMQERSSTTYSRPSSYRTSTSWKERISSTFRRESEYATISETATTWISDESDN